MRGTYITAIVIAVLTALWLASGQLIRRRVAGRCAPNVGAAQRGERRRTSGQRSQPASGLRVIRASLQDADGPRARAHREQAHRAGACRDRRAGHREGGGARRPGARRRGLCAGLSMEDRAARLTQAREAVNQAQIEYQGKPEAAEPAGFQSETAIATAKARLATAQAQLTAEPARPRAHRTFAHRSTGRSR